MVEIQRIKMHVAFLLKNVPRVIDKKRNYYEKYESYMQNFDFAKANRCIASSFDVPVKVA